jgi:hypothetical protein
MALMLGMHARIEEERSSFLKERSKKLLPVDTRAPFRFAHVHQRAKVFWFFFFKKEHTFFTQSSQKSAQGCCRFTVARNSRGD